MAMDNMMNTNDNTNGFKLSELAIRNLDEEFEAEVAFNEFKAHCSQEEFDNSWDDKKGKNIVKHSLPQWVVDDYLASKKVL